MIHVLDSMLSKLATALQSVWGWIVAACLFIVDYFAGHAFIVKFVVAVTVMDAIWGIAVSLKQGKFTLSELARQTIVKFAVYGTAMFVFVGIDKAVDTELCATVVGVVIALVELWSSCGSMLILYPHLPVLRLLKKALTGEIASKLRIEAEEVESILESTKKKGAKK